MTKCGVVPPRTSVAVAAQLTLVAAPSTSVPGGPLCYRMMVRRPLLPYISQPILPHVSSQRDQSLCATFYCLRLLVGPNLRVSILTRPVPRDVRSHSKFGADPGCSGTARHAHGVRTAPRPLASVYLATANFTRAPTPPSHS